MDQLATYDFQVTIVTISMSCTIFEINDNFDQKLQMHFMYLTPLLMGFPLAFCNGVAAQKILEWCAYQIVKNCDDSCIRLDTVLALDRWWMDPSIHPSIHPSIERQSMDGWIDRSIDPSLDRSMDGQTDRNGITVEHLHASAYWCAIKIVKSKPKLLQQ